MAWGKIDDKAYDHAKTEALADLEVPRRWPKSVRLTSLGVYWLAISWCNRHRTDGFVSERAVVKLADLPRDQALLVAEALVEVGLWERVEGGYQVHDYLDFNKSAVEIEAEQAKKAVAGKLGGLARGRQLARDKQGAEHDAKHSASTVLSKTLAPLAKPPTQSRPSSSPAGEDARAGQDVMAMVSLVEELTNRPWAYGAGNRVAENLRFDIRDYGRQRVETAIRASAAAGEIHDPNVLVMDAHKALNPYTAPLNGKAAADAERHAAEERHAKAEEARSRKLINDRLPPALRAPSEAPK